jgi:phosphoglycerate dehydrogenase-like enzyme
MPHSTRRIVVTVPTEHLRAALHAPETGVDIHVWDMTGAAPVDRIDMAVGPYMAPPATYDVLTGIDVGVLQLQSIGYDGVAERIGSDIALCNAAGAHEPATAELAVALILASRRSIPNFVEAQVRGEWAQAFSVGLRGQRVLVVGAGGIASEVTRRLIPFGVTVTRIGQSARVDDLGIVESVEELPLLLPNADVVVLAVPLSESTNGMVDEAFLAALPDNALVVNVARGPVVRTDALIAELLSGRLFAALDVTDPEPLPAGHPLWSAPNLLISPHVGGRVSTMIGDIEGLLRSQIQSLRDNGELANLTGAPPKRQ